MQGIQNCECLEIENAQKVDPRVSPPPRKMLTNVDAIRFKAGHYYLENSATCKFLTIFVTPFSDSVSFNDDL